MVNLVLPPLRERLEDVALLADHFVRKYADANAVPPRPLSTAALAVLKRHAWPGNVRELENTMHRAVLLATEDEIEEMAIVLPDGSRPAASHSPVAAMAAATGAANVSSLPVEGEDADAANLVGRTVAEVERQLIVETLDHCLGNRTHAANILGISIRTLRNKLKAYTEEGISVPGPGEMRRYAV